MTDERKVDKRTEIPIKLIVDAIYKFRMKFNKKAFQKREAYDYIEEFERELGIEVK